METLNAFGIKEVSPHDFLTKEFNEAVFTKAEPWHYVRHKHGKEFDLHHFFNNPHEHESTFEPYTKVADLYIACVITSYSIHYTKLYERVLRY